MSPYPPTLPTATPTYTPPAVHRLPVPHTASTGVDVQAWLTVGVWVLMVGVLIVVLSMSFKARR